MAKGCAFFEELARTTFTKTHKQIHAIISEQQSPHHRGSDGTG